jgi:hypothetical protein
MTLGKDLAKAWNSPGAPIETRKKIIRLLLKEIIVDLVDDTLALVIHWQGGDHTQLAVKKNKVGQTRWMVAGDVVDLVRALARQLSDTAIAAVHNQSGKLTAHGSSWTRPMCAVYERRTALLFIAMANEPSAAKSRWTRPLTL